MVNGSININHLQFANDTILGAISSITLDKHALVKYSWNAEAEMWDLKIRNLKNAEIEELADLMHSLSFVHLTQSSVYGVKTGYSGRNRKRRGFVHLLARRSISTTIELVIIILSPLKSFFDGGCHLSKQDCCFAYSYQLRQAPSEHLSYELSGCTSSFYSHISLIKLSGLHVDDKAWLLEEEYQKWTE
ncbi:hypothetical protein SDJN03_10197, partial [Cucurbita argyrosperma subsp. sororia]